MQKEDLPRSERDCRGSGDGARAEASAERKSTNSSSVESLKENDMERAIVEKEWRNASRNKQRALMSAKKTPWPCGRNHTHHRPPVVDARSYGR